MCDEFTRPPTSTRRGRDVLSSLVIVRRYQAGHSAFVTSIVANACIEKRGAFRRFARFF
jgi:hypothetical protein